MNPLSPSTDHALQDSIQTLTQLVTELAAEQRILSARQAEILQNQQQLLDLHKRFSKRQIGIHTPHFTQDWFSNNIPVLQSILAHYAGEPDIRFLEVGSYEGRSTLWFLQTILTHPTATIHCIDPFEHSLSYWEEIFGVTPAVENTQYLKIFNHNIEPYQKKVTAHVSRSDIALRTLPTNHFDIIYIDGSHKAPDVYLDALLSFPLLKPKGVMIFDDYEWKGYPNPEDNPKAGIDRFLAESAGHYQFVHHGFIIAIQKL